MNLLFAYILNLTNFLLPFNFLSYADGKDSFIIFLSVIDTDG